ncbi:MAG: hypothetical protein A2Y25_08010 [Candidatus Melainabacteria bacterium GWF2_37_15]|nr:MAG: hypothetical protein A2Y25_08010 [Candidatus Melainabacteria bacterium GWF2_37_15]
MVDYISNKTIEKLKHDLVREGLVSVEDLARVEELSVKNKQNLAQLLIEEKLISEEAFLKFIQDNLHIPYVNLEDYSLDEKCLDFISAEDARKYKILPLFKIENTLTIAMADPLDLFALNNLIKCVSCQIEPIICSERLVLEYIDKFYFHKELEKENEVSDWTNEQTIINSVISQAIQDGIFEIIFEELSVKFRKPGIIQEKGSVPRLLAPLMVSHLKNMAGLDVAVVDVPQLGKFKHGDITCVVSAFPCTKGERITVKLYKPPKTVKELQLDVNIDEPGIILIAGPELSGKSFVAYSILNSLDSSKKNIMTLESIAKYDLNGVTQCEMNEAVGFNIEKALKFVNFQSPDVVYIEEIPSVDLLRIAKAGKLIITETSEVSVPESLKKMVNYMVFVENIDEITVTELRIS